MHRPPEARAAGRIRLVREEHGSGMHRGCQPADVAADVWFRPFQGLRGHRDIMGQVQRIDGADDGGGDARLVEDQFEAGTHRVLSGAQAGMPLASAFFTRMPLAWAAAYSMTGRSARSFRL